MLFHEVYGKYYLTLEKMIGIAQQRSLTMNDIRQIAAKTAFSESSMEFEAAVREERWPVIGRNGTTSLENVPCRSMTILERRWLRAILDDPRAKLFGDFEWDDDVEPLFRREDFAVYDRYLDGDAYDSPEYVARFRTILQALREKRPLQVEYYSARGNVLQLRCHVHRLEYSEKDDKFRIMTCGKNGSSILNLSRIASCEVCGDPLEELPKPVRRKVEYVLELTDKRNALERALMQLADLEKRTEHVQDDQYKITLYSDEEDEPELLIRVLSFGPMIKAVAPESFVEKIRARLIEQMQFDLN